MILKRMGLSLNVQEQTKCNLKILPHTYRLKRTTQKHRSSMLLKITESSQVLLRTLVLNHSGNDTMSSWISFQWTGPELIRLNLKALMKFKEISKGKRMFNEWTPEFEIEIYMCKISAYSKQVPKNSLGTHITIHEYLFNPLKITIRWYVKWLLCLQKRWQCIYIEQMYFFQYV